MGFQEVVPSGSSTRGLAIAVASIHIPVDGKFSSFDVADAVKADWSRDIANRLEVRYGVMGNVAKADRFVIAGDFNTAKCHGSARIGEGEPADAGDRDPLGVRENPACLPKAFWTDLAAAGYVDTVYAANSATINNQYRDGDWWRKYRIDHVFVKGDNSYLAASFDLTCGEVATAPVGKRNCAWLKSSERYSDHRLVWTLTGLNPLP